MNPEQLMLSATTALTPALAAASYALARIAPLPRPRLGHRGLQRSRALTRSGFSAIEPAMRWLAALVAHAPISGARTHLDAQLTQAGQPLGLCSDELLALCALGGAAGALLGAGAIAWLGIGHPWQVASTILGAALPSLSIHSHAAERLRRIARQLPPAIDLLALCMGAGLDFAGALELLCRELYDERDPFNVECKRVLEELSLGRTRRQALATLAERVPGAAMRDFTNAVIQAEEKGNPLAEVLSIQARMMRMRRSVAAEEAAARASVLLVLPMMLLLAAVMLVLLGPFVVNGFGF